MAGNQDTTAMPIGDYSWGIDQKKDIIAASRRQSLSALLKRTAFRHRDRIAIICGETRWSYNDLERLVERLAAGLVERGVRPGDRIALLARNSHAFMAVRFAVARADAILVPINFMLNVVDAHYVLEHSGVRMLFVDSSTIDLAREAAPANVETIYGIADEAGSLPAGVPSWEELASDTEIPPHSRGGDDILQIIYTSGTESRPKGAMLSHNAVLWEYQSCIIDCEWTANTIALHSMPLFHCAQLDCMIGPSLQVGGTNIITSNTAAENILRLLEKHAVNSYFAPPTVWIALLRSPERANRDVSNLRKGYYGASVMPVEILYELDREFPGIRLWNLYGQTEIAPVAAVLFPEEHATRCGAAGRPTQHVESRIVDDFMKDVAPGVVGEIVHRSPQLLSGYWNDRERTAEAFSGGWFHSGDLGWMDEEGYITVVDRKKDMIKSGGENVSSREVEEILYQHPGVSEVAVIGLPDPKWIEAVVAVIVVRPGHTLSERDLLQHSALHLSGFKRPKRIIFREDLPRNASGKILKRELRLRLTQEGT